MCSILGNFLFFFTVIFFIVVVRVRLRILTIGDAEYLCIKDHRGVLNLLVKKKGVCCDKHMHKIYGGSSTCNLLKEKINAKKLRFRFPWLMVPEFPLK